MMKLKRFRYAIGALMLILLLIACGNPNRYNTQRGAAIGAGVGALAGQAIGRNTNSTLIGAGVGTLLGAIVGNAVDQERQAAVEAAAMDKRIVYYDNKDRAIEAIPGPEDQHTKCRKVTMREWDRGNLVSEKVEEVCEGEKVTSHY
ncbi:MAG: glycine zipper domain-containing protein [Desulfobacterales bacterium]|jgi:uncharacterized protein YcfJ